MIPRWCYVMNWRTVYETTCDHIATVRIQVAGWDCPQERLHAAQGVINVLILMNCVEFSFNGQLSTGQTVTETLRIGRRKFDLV